MRVISIYKHYWPDTTPYARLLRSMLEDFYKQGYSVEVFTGQPSYNDLDSQRYPSSETVNGVYVRRIELPRAKKTNFITRLLSDGCFLIRALVYVLRKHHQYDVIIANVHPPILMGATLRLIKFLTGVPFILHCQDIYPEALSVIGSLNKNSARFKFFARLDARSCKCAYRVVVLTQDMQKTLERRDVKYITQNVSVINNFALARYDSKVQPTPLFREKNKGVYRILFAGNLGRFQNLGLLVNAMQLLHGFEDIHLIFMGAGSEKDSLVDRAKNLNGKTIFFEKHQSVEVAFANMKMSHLGVVSLAPNMEKVAFPSKVMTYLDAGLPILGLVNSSCELTKTLENENLGWVPSTCSQEDIAETIIMAYRQRNEETWSNRQRIKEQAASIYGEEKALKLWRDLLSSMQEKNTSAAEFPPRK